MSLQWQDFHPKMQVTARTWRGQSYNLTNDVVQWTTQKDISQPQGSFSIYLTANSDSSGTWADKIQPMDYIEIQASATGATSGGQLPVIMRGFVDYVGISTQFGQTGGPSEPRVVIQGRDYSKLLLDWQILYLWTQNIANSAEQQTLGLDYYMLNQGLNTGVETLNQLFQNAFKVLVDPIFSGLKSKGLSNIPSLNLSVDFPDYEVSINAGNMLGYQGSYWNFFSYYASPPFGELFIRETESYPEMVARVTPYHTYDGKTPSPGTNLSPSITIPEVNIQSSTLGITDTDVYTYYLTWGDATGTDWRDSADICGRQE